MSSKTLGNQKFYCKPLTESSNSFFDKSNLNTIRLISEITTEKYLPKF